MFISVHGETGINICVVEYYTAIIKKDLELLDWLTGISMSYEDVG